MAQNIFNLYSASIFADHPLALWSLDDDFSYLSLISASPVWTIVGGSSSSAEVIKSKPGETVGVADADIEISSFVGSASSMIMKAQSFNTKNNLDVSKYSVCVSSFLYSSDGDIDIVEIGFEYADPTTSQIVKSYNEYDSFPESEWVKIELTEDFINDIDGLLNNGIDVYPYLKIIFKNNFVSKKFSLYNFSVGQWSEEYNSETVGSVAIPFTSLSASSNFSSIIAGSYAASPQIIKAFPIDAYSLDDASEGYYMIENNKMLATNTKLTMVYGSGNITEIYPSNYGNPSIIFPGKGFLNETGKYKQLTCEFWMRINPNIGTDFRIFGPLASDDGLFVRNGFLILKIGPHEKSHFVGKWYRPMLIDITYTSSFASVMINGENVIQMPLTTKDVLFPSTTVLNTDWLAFYSHEFINPFEIDCIAIYPYIVSEQVAKKKFVFAQGVGKSNDIVTRFGGSLTNVDFSFADYTNTVSYPGSTAWTAGTYSNVEANSNFISLPSYSKPTINYIGDDLSIFSTQRFQRTWAGLQETTLWQRWLDGLWQGLAVSRESEPLYDNYFAQTDLEPVKHISFRPSSLYNNLYGSINFPSMNMITERVASITGIFSVNPTELQSAINDNNINKLTLMNFKNNSTGDIFRIYMNAYSSGSATVVYEFNSTQIKTENINIYAADVKFMVGIDIDKLTQEYSFILKNFFLNPDTISFAVGGYEKDMFTGKIYKVTFNNKFFTLKDLSTIFDNDGTINHSITSPLLLNGWPLRYIGNYTLLFKKTNLSMIMDIGCVGYWEDSVPLSFLGSFVNDADGNKTKYDLDLIQFNIDYPSPIYSSNSVSVQSNINVDAFVSIKKYEDVGFIGYLNYTNTKEISSERIIDFEDSSVDVDNTKFRAIDNTIIFSPKTLVDFNKAYITTHLEIKSDGVSTDPVNINRMSLSSLAYDELSLYAIGSLTGNKMYPFVRSGYSYSNKIKNPFIFYKDSMPYLYLTSDSGAFSLPYEEVDSSSASYNRGLSLPINPNKNQNYNLFGISAWIFFNENYEFNTTKKIASILLSNGNRIHIKLVPTDNGKRAKIQAYMSTPLGETIYENINYYQNGILLENQYIRPLAWSFITFDFPAPLNYNNFIGQIEIHPGIVFNNLAVYEGNIDKKVDDIFESHLGLSNIVAQDESTFFINSNDIDIFTDIQWSLFSGKPV
jgi:hypothetical protein